MKETDNIVRGYWTCPYCESKDIDGLVDYCPNCGRHKPENVQYEVKVGSDGVANSDDILTDAQLNAAGISREECDGDHEEWVCNCCNSLNNWADMFCSSCGSPKSDATHKYGMEEISILSDSKEISGQRECDTYNINDQILLDEINQPSRGNRFKKFVSGNKRKICTSLLVAITCLFAGWMFWPIQEIQTVTDFSWSRSITIEEERTVKESGWSVPLGGRVYKEASEFHHYEQVLDHYETVEEQKSRQVIDHYETVTVQRSRQVVDHYDTSYSDNGNGTFTEHKTPVYTTEYYTDTEQQPVYKTEYYTETHQEPVYRDEAVYQTKYYYEIDRWFSDYTSDSSGADHDPYWNTNYTLEENERDIMRNEIYYVYYTDEDGQVNAVQSNYYDWAELDYGDQAIVTTSRIGIDYKIESAEKGE